MSESTAHHPLKQCPSCGAEEGLRFHHSEKGLAVVCGQCGKEGPVRTLTEETASKAWNDLPRDFDANS